MELPGINYLNSLVKRRWPFLIFIAVIIFFPVVISSYSIVRLGVVLAIYAIIITGMTVLTRYLGIVSLGHAGFFAIGAYTSSILCVKLEINPWLAMIGAALLTVVIAFLFCVPFLKLRHIYLGMATLGLGQVVYILSKSMDNLTGGAAGFADIPYLQIGSLLFDEDKYLFYLAGFILIIFTFIVDNLGQMRLGRAYHAIQSNEKAARASGINVQKNMLHVFCFSAFLASIAGSILAHFITFISPESFTMDISFACLIIILIGGANIWSTLITAVILLGFQEAVRGLHDFSTGVYALLLIVTFFVFPDGLASVIFPRSKAAKKKSKLYSRDIPENLKSSEVKNNTGKILEVNDVSFNYGGTQALLNISLSVEYNQIMGIIGPNGAGKTTLLNILNGFLMPLNGTIKYQNTDITHKQVHELAKMKIARTFQLVNLFKGMTVIENVMVGRHLKGKTGIFRSGLNLKTSRDEEHIIWDGAVKSLESLGLMHRAYDIVDNLSFGEQRQVELARALALEPDLLLLDEPAAGLNTAETEKLADNLRNIRDQGITIILVEHNMPLVMSVSDTVFVLNFGMSIACGTPEFVCKEEKVITAYLGKEAKNVS
ncbi:MAG: branched-chain amino acid ABC transporter ATP-binding protein/permease [Spirochaetes bacterium]|nr:branched-chain amino acid ABC transporter ATP-binding protein/permease [Spirochaetota bacterium]